MIPKHVLDDIIAMEAGDYVYWPIATGYFTSANLREIADHLDELNKRQLIEFESELPELEE